MKNVENVISKFKQTLLQINKATVTSRRNVSDIKLMAVSKTQTSEAIRPLLEKGHLVFGENQVIEAEKKWPTLLREFSDIELHLIGPLQANKVKRAVGLFDVIQTVDRLKIAKKIAREAHEQNRIIECYAQINIGEEKQKAGVSPNIADEFISECLNESMLPITGLMCIPPLGHDPQPYFDLLACIGKRNSIEKLSMGMSEDFDVAISCGATEIRVGAGIFGTRESF